MATVAEQLQTAKAQAAAILVQITLSPKPSYNLEGQSVQHTEYVRMLTDSIKAINELQQAESPFLAVSQMI